MSEIAGPAVQGETTETPSEQIKREIEDPDAEFVGPYRKNGFDADTDNAFAIEALAWAAGWKINAEGYCEPM